MRVLSLATLTLALTGCVTAPVVEEVWPQGAPAAMELDAVPFHPQTGFECGPAALATVLGARGVDVTPDALVPEIYVPDRKGSLQPEIVAGARSRGLIVYPVRPELADLLGQVQADHPVLVLQNLGLRRLPAWHYAVVVGADPEANTIVLRSGKTRRRVEGGAAFLRRWDLAERWGIVVLEPGELPASPDWIVYLGAVADLESSGHLDGAAAGYSAALAKEPTLSAARFGLANVKYRAGAYAEAAELYTGIDPDSDYAIPAMNNLANLHLDLGCTREATALLDRADRLTGPDDGFSAALASTRARLDGTVHPAASAAHCP